MRSRAVGPCRFHLPVDGNRCVVYSAEPIFESFSLPFSPGKINDVLVNERNCFAAEVSPRDERGQCVCRSGRGL